MSRIKEEKLYWNEAALDKDVDDKYICNIDTTLFSKKLDKLKGDVLEVGCGVGRLIKDGWYGIDVSENMLNIAKVKKPKCVFEEVIKNEIPFDKKFNAIYSFLVFQHIYFYEFEEYVSSVASHLKKNGVFMFQFITGEEDEAFSHHYNREKVEKCLLNNGFKIVSVEEEFIYKQWTVITAKKL